jgi:hypothetical protein
LLIHTEAGKRQDDSDVAFAIASSSQQSNHTVKAIVNRFAMANSNEEQRQERALTVMRQVPVRLGQNK